MLSTPTSTSPVATQPATETSPTASLSDAKRKECDMKHLVGTALAMCLGLTAAPAVADQTPPAPQQAPANPTTPAQPVPNAAEILLIACAGMLADPATGQCVPKQPQVQPPAPAPAQAAAPVVKQTTTQDLTKSIAMSPHGFVAKGYEVGEVQQLAGIYKDMKFDKSCGCYVKVAAVPKPSVPKQPKPSTKGCDSVCGAFKAAQAPGSKVCLYVEQQDESALVLYEGTYRVRGSVLQRWGNSDWVQIGGGMFQRHLCIDSKNLTGGFPLTICGSVGHNEWKAEEVRYLVAKGGIGQDDPAEMWGGG